MTSTIKNKQDEYLVFNLKLSVTDEIINLLTAYSYLINSIPNTLITKKKTKKKTTTKLKPKGIDELATECYRIVDILMEIPLRSRSDVKNDYNKEYSNFLEHNNSNPDLEITYNEAVQLINFLIHYQRILSTRESIKRNELDTLNNDLNDKIQFLYELTVNKFKNYNFKDETKSTIVNSETTSSLSLDHLNLINESSINSPSINSPSNDQLNTIDNQSDLINQSSNSLTNSIKNNQLDEQPDLISKSNSDSFTSSIKNNQLDEKSDSNDINFVSIDRSLSSSTSTNSTSTNFTITLDDSEIDDSQMDYKQMNDSEIDDSQMDDIQMDDVQMDDIQTNDIQTNDTQMDDSSSDIIEIEVIKSNKSLTNPIISKEDGKYVINFKNIDQLLNLQIEKLISETFYYYDEKWNVNLYADKFTNKIDKKRYLTIGLKHINKNNQDKIKVDFQFALINKKSRGIHKIEMFNDCLFEPQHSGKIWLENEFVSYNDLKKKYLSNNEITIELTFKSVERL